MQDLKYIMIRTYCKHMSFSSEWSYLNFNPFVPNAPFLYPLKTSENRKVFWCFQRVEKGCTGNEWVNANTKTHELKPKSVFSKFTSCNSQLHHTNLPYEIPVLTSKDNHQKYFHLAKIL